MFIKFFPSLMKNPFVFVCGLFLVSMLLFSECTESIAVSDSLLEKHEVCLSMKSAEVLSGSSGLEGFESLVLIAFNSSGRVENSVVVDPSDPSSTMSLFSGRKKVYAFANCGDMSQVKTISDLDEVCWGFTGSEFDGKKPPFVGSIEFSCNSDIVDPLEIKLRRLLVKVTLESFSNFLDSCFGDLNVCCIFLAGANSRVSYSGLGSYPLNVGGRDTLFGGELIGQASLGDSSNMYCVVDMDVFNGDTMSFSGMGRYVFCCPCIDDSTWFCVLTSRIDTGELWYYTIPFDSGLLSNREYKIDMTVYNPGTSEPGVFRSGMFDFSLSVPAWTDGGEFNSEI